MGKLNSTETSKALLKNTSIIAIGQISTRIVNFFLLPLYTAILTTEEYGLVDLLTTYSGLLVILIGLQMNQAIFRFLVTKRSDTAAICKTVSTIFFAASGIMVVYAVAFIALSSLLSIQCKWFLLAHVICCITLQTMSGIARGLGRNADYAIGNFISSAAILLLNVLVIAVWHFGVVGMLTAYILGPILGAAYLFFRCRIYKYISIRCASKKELFALLKYSIPLVPNELSWSIIHSSDRWIVSWALNIAANGLIAVASKFSLIYTTFFSIFNTAWTEQVVLHYKDEGGPSYINNMFGKMVTLFASFAIGIIAVMPFAFKLLVNKQYSEAYGLIPLYMIAVFFNALIGMLSSIYLSENETRQVAVSTMVAAIINVAVDFALIGTIGIYAAPVSSICGYASISAWRLIDVNKRHCKVGVQLRNLLTLAFMLLVSLLSYYSKTTTIQVISLLIVSIIALWVNQEVVYGFLRIALKKFNKDA